MKWGPDVDVPIGSIIVCVKDMGYLKVDAITPEGVIANCAFGPFLYTWSMLDDLWAKVESTPGSPGYPTAAARSTPPRLVRRGGRVHLMDGVPHMDTDSPDAEARELDLACIPSLVAAAPADWQQVGMHLTVTRINETAAKYSVNFDS